MREETLNAAMLLRSRSANAKAREAAVIANAVEPRAESAYYYYCQQSLLTIPAVSNLVNGFCSTAVFHHAFQCLH